MNAPFKPGTLKIEMYLVDAFGNRLPTNRGIAVAGYFPHLPPTPCPTGLPVLSADERLCSGCQRVRPLAEFGYGGHDSRARAARCKSCRTANPNARNGERECTECGCRTDAASGVCRFCQEREGERS